MADIKLDFQWDIESDGSMRIEVAPSNAPNTVLGSFVVDEELIEQNLNDDIKEFHMTGDDYLLLDWDALASFFEEISVMIRSGIEKAKEAETSTRRNLLAQALARKFN